MTDPIKGSASTHAAAAAPSSESFREFVVKRDSDRPLSFAGIALARAESSFALTTITATLYRTRGGKFIASLQKGEGLAEMLGHASEALAMLDDKPTSPKTGYAKAAVFDTFEEALGWFRPGRLTDELRRQLGLNEPVRID